MKYSKAEIQDLLIKFYPDIEEKEARLLISISTYKVFQSREIILKKERTDKKIVIILKGSLRSYSIVDGVERNCHLRSEGFLMGDPASFEENQISRLDSEAITDCHVLMFDMGEFEEIAFGNPKMMALYLTMLKEIIVVFSHRISSFVTMNATERYEHLMQWNPLYLKSTYDKHLASFLGITPLTFHRVKHKK
ncbi:MAG: CRP-like cAMP-binding protein [Psychroserpens sp.]|jgi:CRP-like cAMP-binding protein|uniref:Crp/Fnr family transcriptional regulator n=1 Tax=Psychroserpens sp. TaxID=2020870 RepID=UPI0039E59869